MTTDQGKVAGVAALQPTCRPTQTSALNGTTNLIDAAIHSQKRVRALAFRNASTASNATAAAKAVVCHK
jgi:hypothetical protein